jgi:signal transduction histidine kinase
MDGKRHAGSLLVPADAETFRRQESIFAVLNLALLGALLLIHTLFASHFGNPSPRLIYLLAAGFLLLATELMWLPGKPEALTRRAVVALTWGSIAMNTALALALALLTDRQDSPYFVLLTVPVLLAAFRLSLAATLAVAAAADALTFFWVYHFARYHGPVQSTEYFEAASLSLIFTVIAVLAWSLVENLRRKERRIQKNLEELELTRERLVAEEKLAAVGRLSSAIAHEIRNPVAMISSSLATAARGGLDKPQREEMFNIAAQEASRLERLTDDFLAYARPRPPQRTMVSARDVLEYVASACRARAAEREIRLEVEGGDCAAEIDAGQIEQGLMNLVVNAMQASPSGSTVRLRLVSEIPDLPKEGRSGAPAHVLYIEVENEGAIAGEVASRLFEPFFTTKPSGTGLGLAIARNLVRANGGEIELIEPGPPRVRFRITLPAAQAKEVSCQES